ncbi:MAG: hypothetical protein HRT88_23555, partial [Lentisphaeraceae bacterium]|nr:hypothetical protein [Lentisphaeraceae bacterium]
MRLSYFLKAAVLSLAVQLSISAETADPSENTGLVKCEMWTDISGNKVADLTSSPNYPWSPSTTSLLSSFENTPSLNNYGSRLRAFITIPESGEYIFYISGDDNVQLYLNANGESFRDKQLIASHTGWSSLRQWDRYSSQRSETYIFTAGQKLYIEALHKEGGGADSLSVGWQRPGVANIEVIDGQFLDAFEYDLDAEKLLLADLIIEASTLIQTSIYGVELGEYSHAAKANLLKDITQAQVILDNPEVAVKEIIDGFDKFQAQLESFQPIGLSKLKGEPLG